MKRILCFLVLIFCVLACNNKPTLKSNLEGSWQYDLKELSLTDIHKEQYIIGSDSIIRSTFLNSELVDIYIVNEEPIDTVKNHTVGVLHFEFKNNESGSLYWFEYDSTKENETLELLKIYGHSYSFNIIEEYTLEIIENSESDDIESIDTISLSFDRYKQLVIDSLTYQKIQIKN